MSVSLIVSLIGAGGARVPTIMTSTYTVAVPYQLVGNLSLVSRRRRQSSTIMARTVAVPAAFGFRCDLVAEFAVSYRHGGAFRAGASTRQSRRQCGSRATPNDHSSRGGGVAAATELSSRPPRPVGGAHAELFWAAVTHGSNRPRSASPAHQGSPALRWSLKCSRF